LKKILVTGACGYLGARLSKYLAGNGYKVTAFDDFDPSIYIQWTSLMDEVVVGDIRDETTLSSLAEKRFDVVIHLISLDHHRSEDNPNFVSSINVMPTWNLLDKFAKKGLKKFIYFSTIHVYGKLPNDIITEDHKPSPQNAYGLTHLLSENICNYFNRRTDTTCINVRISNSYGSPAFQESNCWWLVINDLCKSAVEKERLTLLSDGSPQRDFIHSSDVARAVQVLIETEKSELEDNIFHIASGNTLTILELAHIVKRVYQARFEKRISVCLPNGSISTHPAPMERSERHLFDIRRINHIGFQPRIEPESGIIGLFDYLESR